MNKETPLQKERRLKRQREWRKKNAALHQRSASSCWEKKNPIRALWGGAKRRARREGIPFNLEPTDIQIPTHCPVLGIELDRKTRDTRPSLDKIIPENGYVKGNVIVVSWKANRLKSNATVAELCLLAKFYLGLS